MISRPPAPARRITLLSEGTQLMRLPLAGGASGIGFQVEFAGGFGRNSRVLAQIVKEVLVPTRGRALYEITDEIAALVAATGWQTGLVTLHLQHTSASLLIQENADPEVQLDLERWFARLAPDGDPLFRHTAEGEDDMPAHARTAITAVNLSLPILRGRLALGTWQGIYLWEHRTGSHRRRLVVHLLGE